MMNGKGHKESKRENNIFLFINPLCPLSVCGLIESTSIYMVIEMRDRDGFFSMCITRAGAKLDC